jgi:hypothetical protein
MLSKDIAFWLTIADARVATSHDYSSIKADTCIELIPAFLDAIQPVIRQLECPE